MSMRARTAEGPGTRLDVPVILDDVRKPRYRTPHTLSLYMRLLLAVQRKLTKGFIRLGVSSRVITCCWFVVALVGYAITAYGEPWSFTVGALVLFLKSMLDITDGEVGRYQGRFMDPATDLRSHMQGVYLDRMQHIIESPLWGLALGFGAFRLTGHAWLLICGTCLAAHQTFSRIDSILRRFVIATFAPRVREQQHVCVGHGGQRDRRPRWTTRVLETLTLWIRNGKRFNLLVLLCGTADWWLWAYTGAIVWIPVLLSAGAGLSVIAIGRRIIDVQFRSTLLRDTLATLSAEPTDGS